MIDRLLTRLKGLVTVLRIRLTASPVIRVAMLVSVVIFVSLLYPSGLTRNYEYEEGTIWNEDDLVAPFSFPIYRNAAIVENEQRVAAENTPWSFDRIDGPAEVHANDSLRRILAGFIRRIDTRFPFPIRWDSESSLPALATLLYNEDVASGSQKGVTRDAWIWMTQTRFKAILATHAEDSLVQARKAGAAVISAIYRKGILNRLKRDLRQNRLALRAGPFEEIVSAGTFLDREDLAEFIGAQAFSQDLPPALVQLLVAVIPPLCKPNVMYNDERTQVAVRAAIERVPRSTGFVEENERIIGRHERVTAPIKAKLDAYQRASLDQVGEFNAILTLLGCAGHTIAILSFLMIYLFLFRKQIFHDNSRLLLILLILAFEGVLAYLSFSVPLAGPVQFLILVPAAAMLYTIIFDSRVAFYGTVTISFLIGALRGNDYSIVLASVLAGTLALYTVRDIKNRTQIFRSLAFIFLGYAFAITVDGMQRSLPFHEMSMQYLFAFFNALFSPVVTFGLLIFFERGFGISTDLTLLELSDFNHPLLRELAAHAPGTFHHSINMGSLAEAAATSIGANAILARVGAYYHDIGKISGPEYFIENQAGGSNIHESMEPTQSARKIISHVTEGIRLAEQYRLPRRVIDFIPAHHGTTLVSFFYEKQRTTTGNDLSADPFRYTGPTPASKETAIVMLADTIEAATRSLEEPTPEKIENLISSVVTKLVNQGQLEHSDLTFRDLASIKRSFLGILTGIHHSRIKYPSETEAETARKAAERTRKLLNLPSTAEAIMKRMKNIDPR